MRLAAGRERGSVLALVPAGFLVLILLGALAVDSAVDFQARQQLHDELSAAANDAVTAGLDNRSYYSSGLVTLDSSQVAAAICRSIASQGDGSLHDLALEVAVGPREVSLIGRARVDAVFGRAVPGFGTQTVSSEAAASLDSGPRSPPAEALGPPEPVGCG